MSKYLPLEYVKQVHSRIQFLGSNSKVSNEYDIYESILDFVQNKINENWDQFIYECIALNLDQNVCKLRNRANKLRALIVEFYSKTSVYSKDPINFLDLMLTLSTVLSWSAHKRVYKVESTMVHTLAHMKIPKEILISELKKLPFRCFYVDCELTDMCDDIKGMFVSTSILDDRITYHINCLVPDNIIQPLLFTLSFDFDENDVILSDISNQIDCTLNDGDTVSIELNNGKIVNFNQKYVASFLINLILYMQAANNDIEYTEFTKKTYRKRKKNIPPKNKMSEVEQFGVGFSYAKPISTKRKPNSNIQIDVKHQNNIYDTSEDDLHVARKYSSHYRSAHWHHYWTKDPDTGGKKLILKWVESYFVPGNCIKSNVTIQKVLP